MTTRVPFLRFAIMGFVVAACGAESRSATAPAGRSLLERMPANDAGSAGGPSLASTAGMTKEAIGGTIDLTAARPPGSVLITPSGRCHFRDWDGVNVFQGDVSGVVTFHEQVNAPCTFNDLVGSGPFDGTVTWHGRTGVIAGQWTTNCNADPSQPIGLSCDGVMNARGTGGLEGVQFHFAWGPGWFPFPYTGTAFSQ